MRPCVCRFQTWGRACLLCFCMCTTAWVLFHGPIPRSLLGGLRGRPLPEGACCTPRTRRTRSPAASWDTRWPRGTGPDSAPLSAGLPPDPQGYREWEGAWLVLTWPHMQEVSHDTFPQGSQASVSPLHSMGPETQAWVARSTACPPADVDRPLQTLAGDPHHAAGSMTTLPTCLVTGILCSSGSWGQGCSEHPGHH